MTDIPIILTKAGRTNTPPAVLLQQLLTRVGELAPGYTADLPGSLIEDVSSTDVGAMVSCDQAVTETINSLTPYGANAFVLNQLGQQAGVYPGTPTNTSVFVTFTGTVGFLVGKGFTVSDGAHQYVVQDGGIIGSGGSSSPLFCVANQTGAWAVPTNSVTEVITSVPSTISLTVTNAAPGLASSGTESEESFRARVLQAGLAAATGFPTFLRTLLSNVPGVQPRLIAIQQQTPGWKVVVGGGDPYEVAFAIYSALFDISVLQGSVTKITHITQANPGVVTTDINHGLTNGQTGVSIAGVVGMTGANGGPYTVTVLTPTSFSFGVDTTGFGAYVSGGAVTPNTRNVSVSIIDYPDTYRVTFVNPPLQTVAVGLTWNTISPNTISPAAVAQLGSPALVDYINSIPVGQPINEFELQAAFQAAVSPVIPPALLTRMVFTISVDGIGVAPESGTGIIPGDPESYFFTDAGSVTIVQG